MPFFRPLSKTAPGLDQKLPWPICGQVYVAIFMGPISAGFFGGLFAPHFGTVPIGLFTGIGWALINGWLCDRYLDALIARNQKFLQPLILRILTNILLFAWALFISAIAMLAPFVAFGNFPFNR